MESLFNLELDCIVITGGSGQLGYEYSKELLARKAKVICLDLYENSSVKKLKQKYPDHYKYFKTDITSKSNLKDVLSSIKLVFGIPTVLINNAALDSPPSSPPSENGPFEEYPESSWDKVINVNLKGVFLCCQIFGSEMAKRNKGSIINISSIYGILSPDQQLYEYRRKNGENFYKPIAYSASKSGLINLTRYLAVYWAKKNVRVNSMTIAGVFNNQDKEFLNAYTARIPIGRMANKDEYNGSIVYLASNASKYMTGHNLIIDGGWTSI